MGINKSKVLRRMNLRKRKETRNFLAHAITVVRLGTNHCWEHEANKNKRPKNWEKKEDAEVGASSIKVLWICTRTSAIIYETDNILFKVNLWELALQKLDKIPVPNNPTDDSCWDVLKQVQSNMKLLKFCSKLICGNLHFRSLMRYWYPAIHVMIAKIICKEEINQDGLSGEKCSSGTQCCLSKIEKLAVPVRVALLYSINILIGDSGASVHCMNDRGEGNKLHDGSGTGTMGAHGKVMTASSIMDIARIWCIKFGKEQLKVMLKDVQYNPKSNFSLSVLGHPLKRVWY